MRITSLVRALLAITVALVGASTVCAQTTTTETLTFDNNQLPSGWSLSSYSASGSINGTGGTFNYDSPDPSLGHGVIQNQRLEIDIAGSDSTQALLTKTINAQNATQIRIDYDSNLTVPVTSAPIPNQFRYFNLSGTGNGASGVVGIFPDINSPNWGNFPNLNFPADFYMFTGGSGTGSAPPILGNYHSSTIINSGTFSQVYTFENGVTIDSGVLASPGLSPSTMSSFSFQMETPPGQFAWMDNLTIAITTAVPEPETYAMLLAGIGLIGVVSRRRTIKQSAKVGFQ